MALGYVRPARGTDVSEIARVQYRTWEVAYPRFIPRFAVEAVRPEWLAERWAEAVTAPPGERHRVLVAIEQAEESGSGGTVAGFTAVGPADESMLAPGEPPPGDRTAAITDLLVEPRWGRRGHGSRLLAATVDLWRDDGFTEAVAWAFEKDVATVKFLTSAGWEPDGATRSLDIEGVLVPQIRFHVALPQHDAPEE